jgi:hypothetical protein
LVDLTKLNELIVAFVFGVNCLMTDISLKGAKLIKVEREY